MGDIMKRGGRAISIGLSAVMGLTAAVDSPAPTAHRSPYPMYRKS